MARIPLAWPYETRSYYQEIYNECLRVEAMLEACLAEYEIDNYLVFKYLLPSVVMRVRHINEASGKTKLYAPTGQGRLPKWFHVIERIDRISQIVKENLDSREMERRVKEHRFAEVVRDVKSIIQASQYIRKLLTSVPMENSRIVMTISGFKEVVYEKRRAD